MTTHEPALRLMVLDVSICPVVCQCAQGVKILCLDLCGERNGL